MYSFSPKKEVEEIEEIDGQELAQQLKEEPFVPALIPVVPTIRIFVKHSLSIKGDEVEYHVNPDMSVHNFIETMVKEDPLANRLHVLEPDPNDSRSYIRGHRFLPNSQKIRKTIRELAWKHGVRVLIEKNVLPREPQRVPGLRGKQMKFFFLIRQFHAYA